MAEAPAGAELVREDAAGFVRALKESEGGDIIVMGGGELASQLIEAGLVDEIGLNVHPLLLGSGTALLPADGAPGRARAGRSAADREGLPVPSLPPCLIAPAR